MSYSVLARRYRSRTFDELVGQEPIAQTLRNAIAHNKVGHAYLFTGTRGVGKTSSARLFAKALNAPGDEPREVAEAIMFALTRPPGCEVRELVVCPDRETSWP